MAADGRVVAGRYRLLDYGETGGRPLMVLELLPGGSLEERLTGGRRLADAEAARIAHEVAEGLAHAHEHGLVHRDPKPANVLFDGEGRAKIADFGIARIGGGTLTEAGTVLGTAATISPGAPPRLSRLATTVLPTPDFAATDTPADTTTAPTTGAAPVTTPPGEDTR